jgi:hypothetical protein
MGGVTAETGSLQELNQNKQHSDKEEEKRNIRK